MVAAVRAVHERVVGTAPDGRPYAASDPHLLRWVHVAEIDSFLAAHQRYGAAPAGRRRARRLRRARPPGSPRRSGCPTRRAARPSCAPQLAAYRPELAGTPAARKTARFLLLRPAAAAAGPRAVRRAGGGRGRR